MGAVLSTRTLVTTVDVTELPTASSDTERTSYWPSVNVVVSHVVAYGDVVSATPRFDHEPAPAGDVWNCTDATPAAASVAVALAATLAPRTFAPATGAVTALVGASPSATMVTLVVAVFPTASAMVTAYTPVPVAPVLHTKAVDEYGPPAGVVTVSAACVVHAGALNAGERRGPRTGAGVGDRRHEAERPAGVGVHVHRRPGARRAGGPRRERRASRSERCCRPARSPRLSTCGRCPRCRWRSTRRS